MVMSARCCLSCGRRLVLATTGRPRQTCSAVCRQAVTRARAAARLVVQEEEREDGPAASGAGGAVLVFSDLSKGCP